MKIKFIFSLILLFINSPPSSASEFFSIPDCSYKELLTTPITFYISAGVIEKNSRKKIKSKINTWINYSNMVLSNSCIPMKRALYEIKYVDELQEVLFQDLSATHSMLRYYLKEDYSFKFKNKALFYGVVFNDFESKNGYCGSTNVEFYPNFFMLAFNCTNDILEHELGHLSWAQHDRKNFPIASSIKNKIKPYAFGFECGGKGTVMSYAKEVLPIYSNPDIYYHGEKCGTSKKANNSKVLRDYALQFLNYSKD